MNMKYLTYFSLLLVLSSFAQASVFEDMTASTSAFDSMIQPKESVHVKGLEIKTDNIYVRLAFADGPRRLGPEEKVLRLCGADISVLEMQRAIYQTQQIAALRSALETGKPIVVQTTGPWNPCLVSVEI